jgi:hypothetical protein
MSRSDAVLVQLWIAVRNGAVCCQLYPLEERDQHSGLQILRIPVVVSSADQPDNPGSGSCRLESCFALPEGGSVIRSAASRMCL